MLVLVWRAISYRFSHSTTSFYQLVVVLRCFIESGVVSSLKMWFCKWKVTKICMVGGGGGGRVKYLSCVHRQEDAPFPKTHSFLWPKKRRIIWQFPFFPSGRGSMKNLFMLLLCFRSSHVKNNQKWIILLNRFRKRIKFVRLWLSTAKSAFYEKSLGKRVKEKI